MAGRILDECKKDPAPAEIGPDPQRIGRKQTVSIFFSSSQSAFNKEYGRYRYRTVYRYLLLVVFTP